ncbi:MAG: Altronate dehydratase [Anaerolineales bacterium]|nr:Altronate dehydratase [Anaerolineales bacterium]
MSSVSIDPPSGVVPLDAVAIRLHLEDNVAIAKTNLSPATTLALDSEEDGSTQIPIRRLIPTGHKVALRHVAPGKPVRRYGQVIGFAAESIRPGEHVHTHNLDAQDFVREYDFGVDAERASHLPASERRTFLGYKRDDERVGTRNYIAVISTVNCSAHTTRQIAHHFTSDRLADYPNIDGVIALAHPAGCTNRIGSQDYVVLQRTLAGMARHPNIGAYILVGLGCEVNQVSDLVSSYELRARPNGDPSHEPPCLVIQELGGIRKTVQAGIGAVEELLPDVNAAQRTPQPVSDLMLALQCGGSDGWSGVTANPTVGLVADEIVQNGGAVVLGETTEIYGAEHLLTRRAISREVGEKLVQKVRWWEEHTQRLGIEIDNNPSPGNKAGGLTTIYEKSLGAVAKAGRTPLTAVYEYAEPVTARGFTFMDSPGYDPVSVTGQVAGGCNLVLFTTGRGSVFGFKPAPSIKISTNSAIYKRMMGDMDLDAGTILDGVPMEDVASELFDLLVEVASGQPSRSEAQGVGEAEFNPWNLGGML